MARPKPSDPQGLLPRLAARQAAEGEAMRERHRQERTDLEAALTAAERVRATARTAVVEAAVPRGRVTMRDALAAILASRPEGLSVSEIWDAARSMGVRTKASDPLLIVDDAIYKWLAEARKERREPPLTKIGTRTWQLARLPEDVGKACRAEMTI